MGWLLVVVLLTSTDVSKASHVFPSKDVCEAVAAELHKVKPNLVTLCLPNKSL